jgi:hypothetical protein
LLLTKVNDIDIFSKALVFSQIYIQILVAGGSAALLNESGKSAIGIISNFPALLFINDLNSLIGIHLIKYLNVHKKGVTK